MIGKMGRVTGRIGPGLVGEIMVAVRGGVEAFYAHPAAGEEINEALIISGVPGALVAR